MGRDPSPWRSRSRLGCVARWHAARSICDHSPTGSGPRASHLSAIMQTVILRSSARVVRRVLVTVLGVAVLGLGVVLLALPGPGVLVIALGFLILSTEYDWARRRFESARRQAAALAVQAVGKPWSTALSI